MTPTSDIKRQIKEQTGGSELERSFDTFFKQMGQDLPLPAIEYVFHSERKWRFDRAWPDLKIGLELQGGSAGRRVQCHNCHQTVRAIKGDGTPGKALSIGGWHGHASQLTYDMEKYNTAVMEGWAVLLFGTNDVHNDPFVMVDKIRKVIGQRIHMQFDLGDFTERQMDVIRLVAAGLKTEDIADRLRIRPHTVKNHIAHAKETANATNLPNLVALLAATGRMDFSEIPWLDIVRMKD